MKVVQDGLYSKLRVKKDQGDQTQRHDQDHLHQSDLITKIY